MEYPDYEIWRLYLLSPTMLAITAYFLLWDHFFVGGVLPYLASYCVGYVTQNIYINLMVPGEVIVLIFLVFLFFYVTVRIGIETWFWRELFIMNKKYYCILAVRDIFNCWGALLNVTGLVKTVLGAAPYGFANQNIGEATYAVLMYKLSEYGFPTLEEKKPYIVQPIIVYKLVNSAFFSISMALLASSVVKLLYFNSLYSYMTAVELFSQYDPFFQMQLRQIENNGNTIQEAQGSSSAGNSQGNGNKNHPSDSDPNPVLIPTKSNTYTNVHPTWGWPLSFFGEDVLHFATENPPDQLVHKNNRITVISG